VEGSQAEYYSDSNHCWMPCAVLHVDAETGAVKVNVKPGEVLDLQEQRSRLRPRTKPSRAQLEWVRRTLREGRLEQEAQAIFCRHASPGPGAGGGRGGPAALRLERVDAAGAELDAKLGVSGSVCALRHVVQQSNGRGLSAEGFCEAFWELLWGVQRDFCQALPSEAAAPRSGQVIEEAYDLGETLGQGTYGLVKLARSRATGARRAVKLISKREHLPGCPEQLDTEMEHLRLLDHPHIVKLYEHFEDAERIYLVMDYCSGGELQGAVREAKRAQRALPELFVAEVMRQVLLAISHVHARGILHLDLKSANIMLMPSRSTLPPSRAPEGCTLADVGERPHAMVIDLGVAQIFRPGNFRFNRPIGTPATMAPEVWRGELHPKADVFSCGVVLFELLSLSLPFACGYDHAQAIRYWSSVPAAPWARLHAAPEYAVGLCRRMLMQERRCRPMAAQCLRAPFLQQSVGSQSGAAERAPQHVLQHLVGAPKRSVLYRSVALSIARAWPANQLPTIKRMFHALDAAGSGRLGRDELEAALERLGVPHARAREAAESMDLSRDGTVGWTEFVAACIDLGSSAYEQDLRQMFDDADSDRDGLLSQQDLSKLFVAEHLREDQAVRDVFADLAGRTEEGARIDWPTFQRHFSCSEELGAAHGPRSGAAPAEQLHGSEPRAVPGLLERAQGLVEWARGAVWPGAEADEAPSPREGLRQLAEMGFADRQRCEEALQRHGNRLSHRVVEELLRSEA